MTTGIDPDLAAARRWAADLLGVPEDAPAAEARRAYLRKLREHEFLPPPYLRHACGVLVGEVAPSAAEEAWRPAEEERLRGEVAAFVTVFFELDVPVRRERWNALWTRCAAVPLLVSLLRALQVGLEVNTRGGPADQTFPGMLARELRLNFGLPPVFWAGSWQRFLREIEDPAAAGSRRDWEKAARYLQAEWPALVALNPELVGHVAQLRRRLQARGKLRSQRQHQDGSPAKPLLSSWNWLFIAAVVISSVIRIGMGTSDKPPSRPVPSVSTALPNRGDAMFLTAESVADPTLRARLVAVGIDGVSPLRDLLDPAKYRVEILDPFGPRVFCFTRRPVPPTPDLRRSVYFGEAALEHLGVTREQRAALAARAAAELWGVKPAAKKPDTRPEKLSKPADPPR